MKSLRKEVVMSNRIILLRGKDIYNSQWHYGDLRHNEDKSYIESAGIIHAVQLETIGQYIIKTPESLDKFGRDGNYANFVEIFEDDIVEARCKFGYVDGYKGYAVNVGDRFVITSYAAGFCAVPIDLYNSWVGHGRIPNTCRVMENYQLWNCHRFVKPIGNIYDNPELLKGGEA